MTPPRTVIGTLASGRWLRQASLRRSIFAVLILICALLTFFPERYRAAVTLTPSDPTSLGFNPTQVQLGALNSVFGNQAAIEIALKVASSVQVRDTILKNVKIQERLDLANREEAHRWLKRHLDIRALRGGIIQIQMRDADAVFARAIVAACADATRQQLAEINRQQTAYKHEILVKLSTDASNRLARAQGAFDTFRLGMRSPDPMLEPGVAATRITALQDSLRQKQIELASARQAYSEDNLRVRQLRAEAATLQGQLAQAQATSPAQSQGVGRAVQSSTQFRRLQRELNIAQSLYDNYIRLLESTAVDDMTSTANIRVLEPPFVDTARQLNYPALAMGIALALLLAAIEFYALRPPASSRVTVRDSYA